MLAERSNPATSPSAGRPQAHSDSAGVTRSREALFTLLSES